MLSFIYYIYPDIRAFRQYHRLQSSGRTAHLRVTGDISTEIPQNFVTPPVYKEADYFIVDAGTEKCHGACCLKGSCRDVLMHEPQMGYREEFDCGLEVGHDHCGGHVCSASSRCFETGERGVCGSVLLSEVRHAPS